MSVVPLVQGSVLVARGEATVVEFSAGMADVDAGVPCSAETRFQIASISKQFTAAAVLLLAERKSLTLDDPIGRWIGGCPDSWAGITLHHLLTHGSGLGHWRDYPMIDLTRWLAPEELLAVFQSAPPMFAPGSRWSYSSPGYVLLAHVAQRAADEPYREFLAQEIFAPLGMARTFAGMPTGQDDIARGYSGDEPVRSFELDSVNMGTGDIWSTTGDLLAWNDGLRAGRLLGADSLRLMFTEHMPIDEGSRAHAYGYGWFFGTAAGEEILFHSGDNAGFKAFNACLPRSGRRIIVLSNQYDTGPAVVEELISATAT